MKRLLPLVIFPGLILSACSNHKPLGGTELPAPTIEANTPEAFRARFASFEITPSDLRRSERKEFRKFSVSQEIGSAKATKLTLQLGERTGTRSGLRTQSRYRVLDELGRVTAEAESTLALPDMTGGAESSILVLTDSSTQSYFIAEEQSWATHRYLFLQGGQVAYLKIPLPNRELAAPVEPRFVGLRDGRLYVEILGHLYAFPIDALERETNLGYSIG